MDVYNLAAAKPMPSPQDFWHVDTDRAGHATRAVGQLAQFAAQKRCQVLAMVEGAARDMDEPDGIRLIRAPKIAKNSPVRESKIGEDSLVGAVEQALVDGTRAEHLVLVSSDPRARRARGRIQPDIHFKGPMWMWREMGGGAWQAEKRGETVEMPGLAAWSPRDVTKVPRDAETAGEKLPADKGYIPRPKAVLDELFRGRFQTSTSSVHVPTCYNCGHLGHVVKDCTFPEQSWEKREAIRKCCQDGDAIPEKLKLYALAKTTGPRSILYSTVRSRR